MSAHKPTTPRKTQAAPKSNAAETVSRQDAFVEAYLRTWDASKAAREAGYSVKTAGAIGHALLKKVEIRARIRERLEELKVDADVVIHQLTDIARGSMQDFITLGERGAPQVDFSAAQDKMHLIKKIQIKPTEYGDEISFELYSRQDALATLAKIHGLMADVKVKMSWEQELKDAGIDPDKAAAQLAAALEKQVMSDD